MQPLCAGSWDLAPGDVLEVVLGKANGDANAAVSSLLHGLPGADADAEADVAAGPGLQGGGDERLLTDRQLAHVQRQVSRRQQLAEFREEAAQVRRLQRAAQAQNGQQQGAEAAPMRSSQLTEAGATAPAAKAAREASVNAPAAPSAGSRLLGRATATVRCLQLHPPDHMAIFEAWKSVHQ